MGNSNGKQTPYQSLLPTPHHMHLKLSAVPSGRTSMSNSHSHSTDLEFEGVSPRGISVDLFKQILSKSAKRASLNVAELVEELDPAQSGMIRLSSIHSFGNTQLMESKSNSRSGIDDIGGHHENTVVLKSPNVSGRNLMEVAEHKTHSDYADHQSGVAENENDSDSEIDLDHCNLSDIYSKTSLPNI